MTDALLLFAVSGVLIFALAADVIAIASWLRQLISERERRSR
jgi:hypothetical protein